MPSFSPISGKAISSLTPGTPGGGPLAPVAIGVSATGAVGTLTIIAASLYVGQLFRETLRSGSISLTLTGVSSGTAQAGSSRPQPTPNPLGVSGASGVGTIAPSNAAVPQSVVASGTANPVGFTTPTASAAGLGGTAAVGVAGSFKTTFGEPLASTTLAAAHSINSFGLASTGTKASTSIASATVYNRAYLSSVVVETLYVSSNLAQIASVVKENLIPTRVTVSITGVAARGASGTTGYTTPTDAGVPLTSISAVGVIGSVVTAFGQTVAITGVAATGALGSPSTSSNDTLASVSGTGAANVLRAEIDISILGSFGTGAIGTVSTMATQPSIRAGQTVREVLTRDTGIIQAGAMSREVLTAASGQLSSGGLVREVLLQSSAAPPQVAVFY